MIGLVIIGYNLTNSWQCLKESYSFRKVSFLLHSISVEQIIMAGQIIFKIISYLSSYFNFNMLNKPLTIELPDISQRTQNVEMDLHIHRNIKNNRQSHRNSPDMAI
jgi:hypothetical protein